jgi:nucleotide-binding universal stress UspA family protein
MIDGTLKLSGRDAMYKRILVCVDGSKTSDVALAEGLKLAKEQRADLRLLHVADVTPPAAIDSIAGHSSYIDYDLFRDATLNAGRDVVRRAESVARAAGQGVESAVIEASAHDISASIVDDASRWRADLVVIGTHGRSGLERLVLGSVAESVARHAPVPVLLVKSEPGSKERPQERKPATRRATTKSARRRTNVRR